MNTNGYSFPEILLMRAEGRARSGNFSGALADLNLLRKNRHITGTPDLNLTGDALIEEITKERRRELPSGSPKRWHDLKRYTLDAGKPWSKTSITHTLRGQTYTANIDSEHFVRPISNEILRFNPQWGRAEETRPWGTAQ
jgi:hypothetical protein